MKRILRLLALAALLAQPVYLALVWKRLPATLPIHFNLAGQPDSFGSRSMLLIVTGVSALVLLTNGLVGTRPALFNLPAARGTPDRARQEALAAELIAWVTLELMLTFGYLLWSMVQLAAGNRNGLGFGFAPVTLLVVGITLGIYLVRIFRVFRAPGGRAAGR